MEPLCLFLHGESDQRNTSESEGDDKRVLEHLASECKMRKVSWSFETQNKEENADVIQTSERDVVGDLYVSNTVCLIPYGWIKKLRVAAPAICGIAQPPPSIARACPSVG